MSVPIEATEGLFRCKDMNECAWLDAFTSLYAGYKIEEDDRGRPVLVQYYADPTECEEQLRKRYYSDSESYRFGRSLHEFRLRARRLAKYVN